MSPPCPENRADELASVFRRIRDERMADVPMLNPALEVEAVGFMEWQGNCLGVLVTPWFMNLMLLPGEQVDWSGLAPGATVEHVLPSGHYDFIVGEEEGIGRYQMCSLFSPMFEFENHEAAVATAQAVMEGVMDEANRDEVSTHEKEIEKIWHGDPAQAAGAGEKKPRRRPISERAKQPMSRRDLLRGALLQDKQE